MPLNTRTDLSPNINQDRMAAGEAGFLLSTAARNGASDYTAQADLPPGAQAALIAAARMRTVAVRLTVAALRAVCFGMGGVSILLALTNHPLTLPLAALTVALGLVLLLGRARKRESIEP